MVVGEVTGFGMNLGIYLKVELIVWADVLDTSSCTNGWYYLLKGGSLRDVGERKMVAHCSFGNANGGSTSTHWSVLGDSFM